MTDGPARSNDLPLFSEREGDFYSPSCHMTEGRGLGINNDGSVIVARLHQWHEARAKAEHSATLMEELKTAALDHQKLTDAAIAEQNRLIEENRKLKVKAEKMADAAEMLWTVS